MRPPRIPVISTPMVGLIYTVSQKRGVEYLQSLHQTLTDFNYIYVVNNLLLFPTVKKFSKLVHI